jgi:RND family efflux transporter MFP subunit
LNQRFRKHGNKEMSSFNGMLAGIGALMMVGSWTGCSRSGAAASDLNGNNSGQPLPVETWTVQLEEGYEVPVRFTGVIEAARESWVGFELSGVLDQVFVSEGDRVSAGAPLASLDTARLEAALAEAKANQRQANSQYELAAWTLDRMEKAFSKKAVSDQDWERSRREAETAEAALEAAGSRVNLREVDLHKATLTAPFDGWVVEVPLDNGETVGPGSRVIRLIDTAPLLARIAVSVEAVGGLNVGEKVPLKLARSGVEIRAKVLKVSPEVQRQTRSQWVWFELGDSSVTGSIVVGDLVEYSPNMKRPGRGFWAPVTALTESYRGLWSCYALVDSGQASEVGESGVWRIERREVEALALTAEMVFLRGGMLDGERMLANGSHRVAHGQLVRVVSELSGF